MRKSGDKGGWRKHAGTASRHQLETVCRPRLHNALPPFSVITQLSVERVLPSTSKHTKSAFRNKVCQGRIVCKQRDYVSPCRCSRRSAINHLCRAIWCMVQEGFRVVSGRIMSSRLQASFCRKESVSTSVLI